MGEKIWSKKKYSAKFPGGAPPRASDPRGNAGKQYGFWNPWTERPAKNTTFSDEAGCIKIRVKNK